MAAHMIRVVLAWLLLFAGSACARGDEAAQVAEAFVTRYYVEANLTEARALATGLAQDKLAREIDLIQGVPRTSQTMDRTITYRLADEKRVGQGKIFYVYDLMITASGRSFRRRTTIATGQENGRWWVTNYLESPLEGP